jgi:hypothetical protein
VECEPEKPRQFHQRVYSNQAKINTLWLQGSATVTKFSFLFLSIVVKNAYKEAVTQNFNVISHTWPELYDDEVQILAAAIKIRHNGKFKCSGVFDVIVSIHAGRAT